MSLFTLILNPTRSGESMMGWEKVEVLAIEPWALIANVVKDGDEIGAADLGPWASHKVRCHYICKLHGDGGKVSLGTVPSDEMMAEVEEGIYVLEEETEGNLLSRTGTW